jgi:hypothetical protein
MEHKERMSGRTIPSVRLGNLLPALSGAAIVANGSLPAPLLLDFDDRRNLHRRFVQLAAIARLELNISDRQACTVQT